MPDSLAREAVLPRLRGRFGRDYAYVESTASTQLLLPPEAAEGTVVVADEQPAGGTEGLAFVGHRTGDQQSFGPFPGIGHVEQGRAQIAIGFDEGVARIVRMHQALFAIDGFWFFSRNLAQHALVEEFLQFGEGVHAVIQAIQKATARVAAGQVAPDDASKRYTDDLTQALGADKVTTA